MPPTDTYSKAAAYAEELIKTHKIVIFSTTTCPYCKKAKKLLTSLNEAFFSLELDTYGKILFLFKN